MTDAGNRQIVLKDIPKGKLGLEHFEGRRTPVPEPGQGELLVRTLMISLDAANRAWMQGATYRDAVKPGDVMHAYIIGRVEDSRDPEFAPGDLVGTEGRWADFVTVPAKGTTKLPKTGGPISHQLSVLGIAAKTAYYGLLKVGKPLAGETVVISAAAGSVGTFAGQIAKILGARPVGIAGGEEKCRWLTEELGYEAAVDYKAGNLFQDLRAACPNGIDVYFDNVGGSILETILFQMNMRGRIVCCGAVSQYDTERPSGPRNVPGLIVVKRLRMEGFIAMDYPESEVQAETDLARWRDTGQIKVIEDVIDGLENTPSALIGLLNGENRGKRMVRVAE